MTRVKSGKFGKLVPLAKQKLSIYWKYLVVFISIFLLLSLIKNLSWVLAARKSVEEEKTRLAQLKKENEKLKREAQEVAGSSFIEQQLRDKLGMAKRGEIVLVLPDEDTLRKLAPDIPSEEDFLPDPIWKQWLHLFY